MRSTVDVDPNAVRVFMRRRGIKSLLQLSKRATALGHTLSYRTVRETLMNQRNWQRDTLVALAEVLDCNPLDLLMVSGPHPEASTWARILANEGRTEIRRGV